MTPETTRPVTILIAALGGEGGGVLADWLIAAAGVHDYPVQSTSVPGVAQRTGATTYYIEIFPVTRTALGGRQPVMSLTPTPGDIDVAAASELVEAGRLIQNGFVDPRRTALIASNHREYAVVEKSAMGDGRYDTSRIVDAAHRFARSLVLADLRALAQRHGTVINTVMFGAMAGAGALPLSKSACEEAIRRTGKAVESSLAGFEAGYLLASSGSTEASQPDSAAGAGRDVASSISSLPQPVREIADIGMAQLEDYQGAWYAALYLERVERLCRIELDAGGGPGGFLVSREAARHLALWMAYEDVIRVADLKTRADRWQRVRAEVGAGGDEPLRLTEFLKPGIDELCSLLPSELAARVRRRYAGRAKTNIGLRVRTDTVAGFAMLCLLRALRPWRPRTSRFAIEHRLIDRWLAVVAEAVPESLALAHELALCGNLVKGYGETSERGHRNLSAILDDAERSREDLGAEALAIRVRRAREAALADPEGRTLAASLGLPAPAMVAKPMRFVRQPLARSAGQAEH